MALSKLHMVPMPEAKKIYNDFQHLDTDSSGTLSMEEFEEMLRERCGLDSDQPIPKHIQNIWKDVDADQSGELTFEEYFCWAARNKWSEELLVDNELDRENRSLAREYDLPILDVERYRKDFNKFDNDGSGLIDQEEFTQMVMLIMKVQDPSDVPKQRLARYWTEIDADHSGEVTFSEFVKWCACSGPASMTATTIA